MGRGAPGVGTYRGTFKGALTVARQAADPFHGAASPTQARREHHNPLPDPHRHQAAESAADDVDDVRPRNVSVESTEFISDAPEPVMLRMMGSRVLRGPEFCGKQPHLSDRRDDSGSDLTASSIMCGGCST